MRSMKSAVEVVEFVLQADRSQPLGAFDDFLAVEIEGLDRHPGKTLDIGAVIGHRKTGLFPHHLSVLFGELGVDHHLGTSLVALFVPLGIDDEEPNIFTELGRGEADARLVVHHFAHIPGEFPDRLGDFRHGLRDSLEARVGELNNFAKGHLVPIFGRARPWLGVGIRRRRGIPLSACPN